MDTQQEIIQDFGIAMHLPIQSPSLTSLRFLGAGMPYLLQQTAFPQSFHHESYRAMKPYFKQNSYVVFTQLKMCMFGWCTSMGNVWSSYYAYNIVQTYTPSIIEWDVNPHLDRLSPYPM